ncbi:hypothetical protein, partial [Staphylococcus capitis]|uniref:hypothetical protein n=1 Tax=Staphylococcus capitis TaxID=29388 RepID=UPI001C92BC5E
MAHQAVLTKTQILPTQTKPNTHSTSQTNLKIPPKHTTPQPPHIQSNLHHLNVQLTPTTQSTKLQLKYTHTNPQLHSIIPIKIPHTSSLNKHLPH